mgnify:CR=1 FL=1
MIAGVGPALVDYIYTIDEYPQRGGHAIVKNFIRMPGGACANVIAGLASFGVRCKFYSTIGRDEDAKFFIESMRGVDLKLNVTHELTGRVDVYVDRYGERTFFVHPNASGIVELRIDEEDYEEVDYFYLDPFPSKRSFQVHVEIAKKAKEHGKFVVLNPGYPYTLLGFERLKELLRFTDLVIISEPEFKNLNVSEDDLLEFVRILVITLGSKGSKAVTEEKTFYQPAFKVERVVDTTGAGDAFSAGFLYGFLKGLPLDICLRLGNFVASYNIQYYGARNFPPREEVDKIIQAGNEY